MYNESFIKWQQKYLSHRKDCFKMYSFARIATKELERRQLE